jgi:phosphoenolpyruvate carboxylase
MSKPETQIRVEPKKVRKIPNATTQAAMLEARRIRARYDTSKDLIDALEGNRAK